MFNKIVSLSITLALASSFVGCSFHDDDNESVIEAAEEYAEAVISLDADSIMDSMADGSEYESIIADYTSTSSNESYSEICQIIVNSFKYEVDEDSVSSSKSSKIACVDIEFEFMDCRSMWPEGEDSTTISSEDYIGFLMTPEASTYSKTIKHSFMLILDDDSWKVKDDDCRFLIDLYSEAFGFPNYLFCDFEEISIQDFENVLTSELGIPAEEITVRTRESILDEMYSSGEIQSLEAMGYTADDYTPTLSEGISCSYDDLECCLITFDNSYAAQEEYFYLMDDPFLEAIINGAVDWDNSLGVIDRDVYNGEPGCAYMLYDDSYYYGGIYLCGNSILEIYVTNSERREEDANSMLDSIGYPRPDQLTRYS